MWLKMCFVPWENCPPGITIFFLHKFMATLLIYFFHFHDCIFFNAQRLPNPKALYYECLQRHC